MTTIFSFSIFKNWNIIRIILIKFLFWWRIYELIKVGIKRQLHLCTRLTGVTRKPKNVINFSFQHLIVSLKSLVERLRLRLTRDIISISMWKWLKMCGFPSRRFQLSWIKFSNLYCSTASCSIPEIQMRWLEKILLNKLWSWKKEKTCDFLSWATHEWWKLFRPLISIKFILKIHFVKYFSNTFFVCVCMCGVSIMRNFNWNVTISRISIIAKIYNFHMKKSKKIYLQCSKGRWRKYNNWRELRA